MKKIKVMIVDDHALLRSGLRALLSGCPDIEVIAEAGEGEAALRLIGETTPEIVLLDISMPGLGGLECVRRIRRDYPAVRVILLTMHEDPHYLREGVAAGAAGYVMKKAADDVLYQAIRSVHAGQIFLPAIMAEELWGNGTSEERVQALRPLSEQEKKVLILIARGFSNAEIATDLTISVKTVETYKARLLEKLNVTKRSELVKYAMEQGLMG
ncbi:MAG: response regulator [Negativicutes bacterium]